MSDTLQITIRNLKRKVQSLTEELLDTYEELNLMYDMAEMFSTLIDYEKVSKTLLSEAVDFLEADIGWLVGFDFETGSITNQNRYEVDLQICSFFNAALSSGEGSSPKVPWGRKVRKKIISTFFMKGMIIFRFICKMLPFAIRK